MTFKSVSNIVSNDHLSGLPGNLFLLQKKVLFSRLAMSSLYVYVHVLDQKFSGGMPVFEHFIDLNSFPFILFLRFTVGRGPCHCLK